MIIHDGKKAAEMILSKVDGDGAEKSAPVSSSYDSGHGDELKAIAEDMFMAIEHKDPHALMTALKAFMGCIQEEDQEQDQEMG